MSWGQSWGDRFSVTYNVISEGMDIFLSMTEILVEVDNSNFDVFVDIESVDIDVDLNLAEV